MEILGLAFANPLVAVFPLDLKVVQRQFTAGLSQLENLIGYSFKDRSLAENAFTHGSRQGNAADYQRLEFLGDRVLSLVIAEDLFSRFGAEREGQLAARLSLLVRGEACAAVGKALGLEEFIILGATEKQKGVQRITSVLGDVVEALIGAIYLDGGLEPARGFILRSWAEMLAKAPASLKDAKTFVQEWALAQGLALPHYEVANRTGPEHAPVFTVQLKVGQHDAAEGLGNSKQLAEMAAASAFIMRHGLR